MSYRIQTQVACCDDQPIPFHEETGMFWLVPVREARVGTQVTLYHNYYSAKAALRRLGLEDVAVVARDGRRLPPITHGEWEAQQC